MKRNNVLIYFILFIMNSSCVSSSNINKVLFGNSWKDFTDYTDFVTAKKYMFLLSQNLNSAEGDCVEILYDRSTFAKFTMDMFISLLDTSKPRMIGENPVAKCRDSILFYRKFTGNKIQLNTLTSRLRMRIYIFTQQPTSLLDHPEVFELAGAFLFAGGTAWKLSSRLTFPRSFYEISPEGDFGSRSDNATWKKAHLTAGSFQCAPHSYAMENVYDGVTFNDVNDNPIPAGIETSIVDIISKKLDFTWNIIHPDKINNPIVNGVTKYNKIMRSVENGSIDFAFCGLWINPELDFNKVAFVHLPNFNCVTFMMTINSDVLESWSLVFSVFEKEVWLTISFVTLGVAFILYGLNSIPDRLGKSNDRSIEVCLYQSYGVILGSLSVPLALIPASRRHVIVWWSFTALLINNYYSSNLVSYLTSPKEMNTIASIEDLVSKGYTWGSSFHISKTFFGNISTEVSSNIFKHHKIINKDFFKNPSVDGLKFAVIGRALDGVFDPGFDIPDSAWNSYEIMPTCITHFYSIFVFKKKSPFIQRFNKVIKLLFTSGIMDKIKKMQYRKLFGTNYDLLRKFGRANKRRNRFNLKTLRGAFFALLFGWSLSAAIFLAEILYSYKQIS